MSRVLVTGGAGFIGQHTVRLLIEKGYDVVVLDNFERQVHGDSRSLDPELGAKVKLIRSDIRFRKAWEKALDGVEYVIHLAAAVGVGQSFWETKKYMDVNVGGTANMFEYLVRNREVAKKIKKIVVASSKSIYGEGAYYCEEHGVVYPGPRPLERLTKKEWEMVCPFCGRPVKPIGITEDKPAQNLNPYALSKYATERLAMIYSEILNVPTVAFRYFNVYGPGQSLSNPYTGVLAIFISRLKNKRPPVIFEDGLQMRDFIYVGDVAKVNVMALERGNGVYNVGTGKPTSLLDVLKLIEDEMGVNIKPNITNDFRPGDNRHDFANISKLRADFGELGFMQLKDGIRRLVEWAESASARDMFEKEERERTLYIGPGR